VNRALPQIATLWLLLRRVALRHWVSDGRQSLLLALILAIGVGCYLSIRMANRAALGQFDRFTSAIESGGSDYVLSAPVGALRVEDLVAMREALGARAVRLLPVVEESAADAARSAGALRLLGVDFVALANFRGEQGSVEIPDARAGDSADGEAALPQVWLAGAVAAQTGLGVGDALRLIIDDRIERVEVGGVLRGEGAATVPPNLVLVDLPDLQRMARRGGEFDRVEVIVQEGLRAREGAVAEVARVLESASGGRWVVNSAQVEEQRTSHLTAAFRLNLTVLSLIALLVAIYLIGQAVDASVVRRRKEIGILRSLGVPPGVIWRSWMIEVLAMGAIGTGLGAALALVLARFTVGAVAETVNALYASGPVGAVRLSGGDVLVAAALGLGASVLAGWIPARDAALTPPAQVIQHGNVALGLRALRNTRMGAGLVVVGAALVWLPPLELAGGTRFALAGYLSALAFLAGGTILAGALFAPLARALAKAGADRAPVTFAASRLREPTSRHRLAAAGLFVAVAMAAAMSFLIGSFEKTMLGWIEGRFKADVFVVSSGVRGADTTNQIGADTWRALAAHPNVAAVEVYRAVPLVLDGRETQLAGADFDTIRAQRGFDWKVAPRDDGAGEVDDDDGAAVVAYASESFASRFDVGRGDTVVVPLRAGQVTLRVDGIFADYGNERGVIVVERALLAEWLQDEGATNVSVYLRPGVDAGAFIEAAQARHPGLRMRDNADLKATALGIFYQTFAVTRALKWIGVFVALAGLALALVSIIRENRDTFRTLRTLGMTRREIGGATAAEALGIAAAGMVGGLVLSVILGLLLIHVINRQSFGWTLEFAVPVRELVGLAGAVLALAALIGFLQGWRAFREISYRDER